jgi:integrase
MSLLVWANMWLENTKKNTITDDWYYELELMAAAFPKELAAKKVCKVAPIELQKFLNNFSESRSKSYTDKMAGLIRALFRAAQENGICGKSPATGLKIPERIETPRQAYTLEQATTILEYAATYRQVSGHKAHRAIGQVIGAAIITLLCTGLRRGEVLGLMWTDITDDKITINRAVYMKKDDDGKRRPYVTNYRAKTKSSLRTLPMPPMVLTAINKLPHYGLYIFGCLNGNLMIPNNFNRSYKIFMRDLKKEHSELPTLNPHECRHTFATLALDGGANLKLLSLMLGHLNLETTARYLHPDFLAMQNVQKAIWCSNRCSNDVKKSDKK